MQRPEITTRDAVIGIACILLLLLGLIAYLWLVGTPTSKADARVQPVVAARVPTP